MTIDPIRAGSLLRRSTSRPRKAFRPRLAALPRCLDTASTTDVSRHEHPRSNTTFGDFLPRAVGKPAGARLLGTPLGRDVSVFLPRRALNHLAVIQPPTAFVLDGTLPALGRLATTFSCRSTFVGGSAIAFSANGDSASSSPLTPLTGDRAERKAPGCLSSEPVPTGARQCDRPLRAPRCLPSSETRASALSRFVGRASFAGRRIRRCTCSSMFENVD
jgi:hypothetical protein